MSLWNWIKENKKTIMLCTCAVCAPFTGGASLAGLTLSASTCSALAVGGAFLVGQGMDQKDKENDLQAQALNNQSNLINSNNQELIKRNNELNAEKTRRKEAEDGIKENQDKLNDPNISKEEKEQAQTNLAFFQQQLDNSNQKISSLSSEISSLTSNIKNLNNLSKWNPFKSFSLNNLGLTDKVMIIGSIVLVIYLLKG